MASADSPIPSWIYRWLTISSMVCIIDGSFCILRPHSLPGGCLEMVFYPYRWYLIADKNYANTKDVFIWTQGLGNLIESAINLLVLFKFFSNIRNEKIATIIVSAMTLWKTILFSLYSLEIPTGHVVETWLGELMVYGMGAFWIIIPAMTIWELAKHFTVGGKSGRKPVMMKANVAVTNSAGLNHVANTSMEEEEESADDEDNVTEVSSPNTRRYNLRHR